MGTLLRRIREFRCLLELSFDRKGQDFPAVLGVRVHLSPFLCVQIPSSVFMLKQLSLPRMLTHFEVLIVL
jgi:hypothetical protein